MYRNVFIFISLCLSLNIQAQEYPSRVITWIVPYLAGTAPDNTVRIVAEAMSQELKQPIIVQNKPGVAGNLGAQFVARSPADGYTWIYSASPMAASMRMYKNPGYDVMNDFIHIGRIAYSDLAIIVKANSGINTLDDLMVRLKNPSNSMSFGSGGIGSPAHLAGELIMARAKVQALHVPYKGASESLTAVLSNQVDFALVVSSVATAHFQKGTIKVLAVTGPARNLQMPNVPTISEAGFNNFKISTFGGLSVPAGTPANSVKKISDALGKVLQIPTVRARLEVNGGVVAPTNANDYTELVRSEINQTELMMKAAHLEIQ